MATIKLEAGSITTLLSTELDSLANNSRSNAGTEFDNSNSSNLFIAAGFELNVTYGTNPTADSVLDLYLVPALDGTNYADGSSSVAPSDTTYVCSFPVRAVTTAQRIAGRVGMVGPLELLPVKYKAILYNNGTGQALASSGNTVKILPFRVQAV
jgi:hypothetical protein